MAADSTIALTTNIAALPGVGSRRADAFRRLGIRCVADLVRHLPARYETETAGEPIASLARRAGEEEINASVTGEIVKVQMARARRSRFEAILDDGTGTLLLTWFNAPWMKGRLHPGSRVTAVGRAREYGGSLQMVNPRWAIVSNQVDGEGEPENAAAETARDRERAVYPATEDLSSAVIANLIDEVLDDALPLIEDHLTPEYRSTRELPELADAYRMIHHPETADEAAAARRRLAFDELLMLQLGVMLKRRHRRRTLAAPALRHDGSVESRILARFPFTLTDGQRGVIDEIVRDLTRTEPMNRLLQGDVGAGKTVVAVYAMLTAVATGHQAALMAPTELLAEQHLASITDMLAGSIVRIELLTGSLKPRDRADVLARLESGDVDIVIGTHALLTEGVTFRSLAVTVIDEQHRFGVHQRASLRTKSGDPAVIPHTLVMTATPIPRTLSLTVFGDLDASVIPDLPPGRRPVRTRRLARCEAGEAYRIAGEAIEAGRQAYVVVPVIDESEAGLTDVGTHLEFLRAGPLSGRRLEAVHGRLSRDERDEIMRRFRRGDVDAIVATTVIEVGVDMPNASVMVIEHADRFGLAQLHQLRGRVGRGAEESTCFLVADPSTDEARRRLEAVAATTDGFEIAERDLAIRGPGELMGAKQSGLAPFHAADLARDLDLLRLARRDAVEWIDANPSLGGERDALLRRRLLKAYGETLGLVDVG